MQPTPLPRLLGDKNKDLEELVMKLIQALIEANIDKAAIRDWSRQTQSAASSGDSR
jgi:hypothetical protein